MHPSVDQRQYYSLSYHPIRSFAHVHVYYKVHKTPTRIPNWCDRKAEGVKCIEGREIGG